MKFSPSSHDLITGLYPKWHGPGFSLRPLGGQGAWKTRELIFHYHPPSRLTIVPGLRHHRVPEERRRVAQCPLPIPVHGDDPVESQNGLVLGHVLCDDLRQQRANLVLALAWRLSCDLCHRVVRVKHSTISFHRCIIRRKTYSRPLFDPHLVLSVLSLFSSSAISMEPSFIFHFPLSGVSRSS